ncbi:MAG: hypothetical protein HSCHL_0030 [Hydrogenibacillus schlegelii]|uniref:Uncharacterized protein n=1 Tax=Hydrogenibacillus schlegelii TaxID=1484 RepID=A0A2T5G9B2_HYDSH|nr:MAG: hypothetical protein HSCHL_0030 [Hydrogenibacillus schlegelii]
MFQDVQDVPHALPSFPGPPSRAFRSEQGRSPRRRVPFSPAEARPANGKRG